MQRDDLPGRWVERLKTYLLETTRENRDQLSATDFTNQIVKISFDDDSWALFMNAFYIIDSEINEVAVFTEHCGYHIFPLTDTRLELLQSTWTDVGT